jgi:hypothetical protein
VRSATDSSKFLVTKSHFIVTEDAPVTQEIPRDQELRARDQICNISLFHSITVVRFMDIFEK